MIVRKKNQINKRKYVHGSGFIDTLNNSLKSVGSYLYQNKDALVKPLLGGVGQLGALALVEGGKKLINKTINKNLNKTIQSDTEARKIIENMINSDKIPVSNILGSGIKHIQ